MFDKGGKGKDENSNVQREEPDNALCRLEADVLDTARAAADEKEAQAQAAYYKVKEMYRAIMEKSCNLERKGTQDVQVYHKETVETVMYIFKQKTEGIDNTLIKIKKEKLSKYFEGELDIFEELDRLKRQDADLSPRDVQLLSSRVSVRDAELSSPGETRKTASRIAVGLAVAAGCLAAVAAIVATSGIAAVALGVVAAEVGVAAAGAGGAISAAGGAMAVGSIMASKKATRDDSD